MELSRLSRRLLRRRDERPDPGARLLELKTRAIDVACSRFGVRSVADLGAVWRVEAGYSFYAARKPGVERVVICDGQFTDTVREHAAAFPQAEIVEGQLGAPGTVAAVGDVDLVLMFDILLHQVDPDWDEMLRMYAPQTKCFALVGPWWRGETTQRLVDLPREEYLELLPYKREHYELILAALDEPHPTHDRPWRDSSDIWQWGIADADLRRVMGELGFVLVHYENLGLWTETQRFDDRSYVFTRREMLEAS